MSFLKLNEQIAFLRRQKGITQEELAQALGVTNQSVSKWESGTCCPDIQLLPDIAKYFGVSTDELLGYRPAENFADITLKIKALFEATGEKECFDLAYKLAFLLAEGAFTKGYRSYVPWDTERVKSDEDFNRGGTSVCNEPEGSAVIKRNAVYIASNKYADTVKSSEIKEIYNLIQPLADRNILKVLFALYELTVDSEEHYVSAEEISEKCCLSVSAVENALDNIPIQLCHKDSKFRIDGPYMQIPPLLLLLAVK